jgi:hypothetical protein
MKKKISKVIIRSLAFILLVSGLGYGIYLLFLNPRRGTVDSFAASLPLDAILTRDEAKEDLNYLCEHLRDRHPAWLDGSDETVTLVKEQYDKELSEIGESITVLELWQAAARIISPLHDGHSWVNWNGENLYIDDITQLREYGDPAEINAIPFADILSEYLKLSSYELDFYAKAKFSDKHIVLRQWLEFCGVDTSAGVTFTYETENGRVSSTYNFVPINEVTGYNPGTNDSRWVYYDIDAERSLGVLTLKTCDNNDEYRSVLDEFFKEVRENKIENIAVDLRGNGGGNSLVANEFIKYIDVDSYKSWDNAVRIGNFLINNNDITNKNNKKPVVFSGRIYVLTNVYTFSSAMDFAMLIGDNDIGEIVGDTPGNKPEGYGDCLYFQLPNSKLAMSVSFKKWHRIDQSKSSLPLLPDYEVPAMTALEKVYNLIGK